MSEMDEWCETPKETTITELKSMCEKLVALRASEDTLKEALKEAGSITEAMELKILNVMKENAMPNFRGEFGIVSIKNNKSITQPQGLEEKLKLFEYLQGQGVFNEMVSVNSRTLSSWATKEIEAKEQSGVFGWVPPGLKPASEYQTLSVRKK